MSKARVEAFSDGVFAIVMTLMVLELHLPQIAGHPGFGEYARAMVPLLPKFISFVMSFSMIAVHWVNHHHFFHNLRHTPLGIVWLNNLLLLWICVLPYPTSMLGEHPTCSFPIVLYALNSLLAALSFFAMRTYASRNGLFSVEGHAANTLGPKRSLPALLLFGAAIPLAFINVYLALACLLTVPALYFAPGLIGALRGCTVHRPTEPAHSEG